MAQIAETGVGFTIAPPTIASGKPDRTYGSRYNGLQRAVKALHKSCTTAFFNHSEPEV
ncbi:MAG: hypothetical protein ACAF41_31680 [Leptolyngbya sp. BL-A-14]